MADALHTPGVVSAAEARLDDAGLIAVQGPTALDARTGVLVGPGTTALVTGTSDTAPMAYLIAPHHWVTNRGVNTDGVYRGALESATRVTTTAAPGTGSRIDVIYDKQGDATSTISADATTAPVYGCVQGTSTTGTPTKPTIPVGAIELATATVSAGATATNGANVTISNTARQTVARGARIPVRSQAERDALAAFPGLEVFRLDTAAIELCTAISPVVVWATLRTAADRTLGDAYLPARQLLGTAMADVLTVTAASTGGLCTARFTGVGFNGASGADRTMGWQVLCDATVIGSFSGVAVPLTGAPRVTCLGSFSSTPAAGAHTWKLQANASAGASVYAEAALLTVVER